MALSDRLKKMVAISTLNYIKNLETLQKKNLVWLGIGSGTTVSYFIDILGTTLKEGGIPFKIKAICSSIDSENKCRACGVPVSYLDDLRDDQRMDLYIDGADEVDSDKNSLKGLGGASTREKLTALNAKLFILIIDASKLVTHLGEKNPVVCEILPFGYTKTIERLRFIDPTPSKVELRLGSGKMGPVITDNGNYLVDVYFTNLNPDQLHAVDFSKLEKTLKLLSGVVETGIFSRPADYVFIAEETGVKTIT